MQTSAALEAAATIISSTSCQDLAVTEDRGYQSVCMSDEHIITDISLEWRDRKEAGRGIDTLRHGNIESPYGVTLFACTKMYDKALWRWDRYPHCLAHLFRYRDVITLNWYLHFAVFHHHYNVPPYCDFEIVALLLKSSRWRTAEWILNLTVTIPHVRST